VPTTGTPELPGGWSLVGTAPQDYGATVSIASDGSVSGTLASTAAPPHGDFGALANETDATPLRGGKVLLQAEVKATHVMSWAGLWLRVDSGTTVDAFDNMHENPIQGTSDWTSYQIELDVAADATDIAYGVLEVGTGSLEIRNLTLTAE
jgi:hypothetical protein